jgi:molybdopterin synthase sulfur carrier subunit
MRVTIRYFAAAAHAAGTPEETRVCREGTTLDMLAADLSRANQQLARVIERSSFLIDETAARSPRILLRDGCTVDVLPPFAGG